MIIQAQLQRDYITNILINYLVVIKLRPGGFSFDEMNEMNSQSRALLKEQSAVNMKQNPVLAAQDLVMIIIPLL